MAISLRARTASVLTASALVLGTLCLPAQAVDTPQSNGPSAGAEPSEYTLVDGPRTKGAAAGGTLGSGRLTSGSAKTSTVRVTGTLTRVAVDSFGTARSAGAFAQHDEGSSDTRTFVRSEGSLLPVTDPSNKLADTANGSTIDVKLEIPATAAPSGSISSTRTLSESQVLSLTQDLEAPATVLSATTTAPAATTSTTARHRAFILLPVPSDFAGTLGPCGDVLACDPADWTATNGPTSEAYARALVSQASDYWSAQSLGAISSLDVAEVRRVKVNYTAEQMCSDDDDDINELINHWDTNGYFGDTTMDINSQSDHLLVFTGKCDANAVDGFAYLGNGFESGGVMQVRNGNIQTLTHELGHHFSFGHSNVEYLGGKYNEYNSEYLGFFSPMALTFTDYPVLPSLDVAYQYSNGVLPASQLKVLSPNGGVQTTTLSATSAASGVRALNYYDPQYSLQYYVEYRDGTGQDTGAFYSQPGSLSIANALTLEHGTGVRVYWHSPYNEVYSEAQQKGSATHYDATLSVGESMTIGSSAMGSLKVTVKSAANGKATVETTVTKPATTLKLANVKAYQGSAPTLTATIGTEFQFSGKIVVSVDGKQVASKNVNPKTRNSEVDIELPRTLSVGTHKVTATLTSDTMASSTGSSTLTVLAKTTPSITLSSPNVAYGKSRTVTATFGGTPSPTGTATVYVDGTKFATATTKNGKATFKLSTKLKPGKHTIKVSLPSSERYNAVSKSTKITVPRLVAKVSGFASGSKTVKVGKTYKDTFTVNTTAKIQKKVNGKWTNIKTVKKGSYTWKTKVTTSTKKASYRVLIKSSSTVKGIASKTLTIKPSK